MLTVFIIYYYEISLLNISLIEFLVYAVVAYPGLIALIFSTQREVPLKTRRMTLVRSMYMVPSIICFILLAGSGVFIFYDSGHTIVTEVFNGTTGVLITNSTEIFSPQQVELQNPVWVTIHYLFALVLAIYMFTQIFTMLSAKE